MESRVFTPEFLEKFFDDNFIEDDSLFEFLKGRHGTIEEIENDHFDDDLVEGQPDEHMVLTIKLKEFIA